ncbi:MAG: hypothetical protein QM820_51785 [Minicystis sp.]
MSTATTISRMPMRIESHRVPDAISRERRQPDGHERDREAGEGGDVLEEHERDGRILRVEERAGERLLPGLAAELAERDRARVALHHHRDAQDEQAGERAPAEAPEVRQIRRVRVNRLVDALVHGERAADREEQERHDERPEVPLGRAAERVTAVVLLREHEAREEQRLVAGVGERVHRLGQRRRAVGEVCRDELARRDGEVRVERCLDDLEGIAAAVARHAAKAKPSGCWSGTIAPVWTRTRIAAGLVIAAFALAPARGGAQPKPAPALIDRVVVRWHAPETGGPSKPQFIFERELAFEARIEALADPDPEPGAYHDRHVRAALERHVAETLLASLPVLPPPDRKVIEARATVAREILEQRVRGRARLMEAAAAEGIGQGELDALFERQARASLYLDKMIAPMLEPSELELRDLWRTGTTPFKDLPFDQVVKPLARWYVGQRLMQALDAYFQNARARVVMSVSRKTPR